MRQLAPCFTLFLISCGPPSISVEDSETGEDFSLVPRSIECFEPESCFASWGGNEYTLVYPSCVLEDWTLGVPLWPATLEESFPCTTEALDIQNTVSCFRSSDFVYTCWVEVSPGWWTFLTHSCQWETYPQVPLWEGTYGDVCKDAGETPHPFGDGFCVDETGVCLVRFQGDWLIRVDPECWVHSLTPRSLWNCE